MTRPSSTIATVLFGSTFYLCLVSDIMSYLQHHDCQSRLVPNFENAARTHVYIRLPILPIFPIELGNERPLAGQMVSGPGQTGGGQAVVRPAPSTDLHAHWSRPVLQASQSANMYLAEAIW
ncbi:unnamed protein product, partial [Protopolystoma xenopodis]